MVRNSLDLNSFHFYKLLIIIYILAVSTNRSVRLTRTYYTVSSRKQNL